jgi:hypothetical protein
MDGFSNLMQLGNYPQMRGGPQQPFGGGFGGSVSPQPVMGGGFGSYGGVQPVGPQGGGFVGVPGYGAGSFGGSVSPHPVSGGFGGYGGSFGGSVQPQPVMGGGFGSGYGGIQHPVSGPVQTPGGFGSSYGGFGLQRPNPWGGGGMDNLAMMHRLSMGGYGSNGGF